MHKIGEDITNMGGSFNYINEEVSFLINEDLPSEYQRVEFLQGNGESCIDTGLKGEYESYIDIQFIDSSSRTLMGANATGNYFGKDASNKYEIGSQNIIDLDATERRIVNLKQLNSILTMSIDGQSTTRVNTNITTSFFLFRINGDTNFHGTSKIYNAKFYQNGNIVRDFIPCYRKSDNVAGMYDTVNSVFYANAGTGDFVIGGNI